VNIDHRAERRNQARAAYGDSLAGLKQDLHSLSFGRRQPQNGTIVQERTVHFATFAMQWRGDPAAQRRFYVRRTRSSGGPVVRHRNAGHEIRDRCGIDEQQGARFQPADRNRIARLYSENDLSGEVRRQIDFRPVGQNQAVYIATRRERVLLDGPPSFRQLRGIPQARIALGIRCGSDAERRRRHETPNRTRCGVEIIFSSPLVYWLRSPVTAFRATRVPSTKGLKCQGLS
jgi:hypothetical protein